MFGRSTAQAKLQLTCKNDLELKTKIAKFGKATKKLNVFLVILEVLLLIVLIPSNLVGVFDSYYPTITDQCASQVLFFAVWLGGLYSIFAVYSICFFHGKVNKHMFKVFRVRMVKNFFILIL